MAEDLCQRLGGTPPDAYLDPKRKVCCVINGFDLETMHTTHIFNRNYSPEGSDLMMKPQYFHSALAVFILLNYPHYRSPNSFLEATPAHLYPSCLKIAIDVIQADPDGPAFLQHSDELFKSNNAIIDQHNQSIVTPQY